MPNPIGSGDHLDPLIFLLNPFMGLDAGALAGQAVHRAPAGHAVNIFRSLPGMSLEAQGVGYYIISGITIIR